MCPIAFAWNCHPRYALALIANRDEFHARPAAPAIAPEGDNDIIGGIDLQAVPLLWERRLSATFMTGADYGTRCSTVALVGHDGELGFEERRFGP